MSDQQARQQISSELTAEEYALIDQGELRAVLSENGIDTVNFDLYNDGQISFTEFFKYLGESVKAIFKGLFTGIPGIIKIAKHEIVRVLSDAIGEEATQLLFIGVIVLGALFYPVVESQLITNQLWIDFRHELEKVEAGFSAALAGFHFSELLQLHQILLIVNEDYRLLFKDITVGFSSLSRELFSDTFFITNVMRNARNVVNSVTNLLGLTPDVTFAESINHEINVMEMVSKKFNDYAFDPTQFLLDIDETIVRPEMQKAFELQEKRVKEFDKVSKLVTENGDNLVQVLKDIARFEQGLPDASRKWVEDQIGFVFEGIDDFVNNTYPQFRKKITDAQQVFDDALERTKKSIAYWSKRFRDPAIISQMLRSLTGSNRQSFKAFLDRQIDKPLSYTEDDRLGMPAFVRATANALKRSLNNRRNIQ